MNVYKILESIAVKYPQELIDDQLRDVKRIAFHINLILSRKGSDITICDIGGGIGLFSVGCAAIGMRSILIDDFKDKVNQKFGDAVLDLHRSYGVEVIQQDVIKNSIKLPYGTIDAITTFASVEHWHNSPKRLFQSVMLALTQDGIFVLGAPNCVSLYKRRAALLGFLQWTSMKDWYETEEFRGHVRELNVNDLYYIARDMGLKDVKIYGRNWRGYDSGTQLVKIAMKLLDRFLQYRPQFCTQIYLVGVKNPNSGTTANKNL